MTIFRLSALVIVVVVMGVVLTPAVGARQQEPGVLLRAALEKEDVAGDLEGAMALYRQIITANGRNRAVTARALLRLAGCYEKLGQTEAEKTYRQLIAGYADQTAEVALARQKLAALTRAAAAESGIVARQVWSGPEVDFSGRPSPDGRYLSYAHPTGNLAIRELATGETRQVTKDAALWTAEGGTIVSLFSPDGRQVVYEWGQWDTLLRLSSVDGSHTRVLLPAKRDWWPEPCDWSSDGRSILIHHYPAGGHEPSEIAVIAVADGSLRVVKRLDPGQRSRNMWFSPDGQYIVHDVLPSRDRNSRDIAIVSVDGTLESPLIEDPSDDYVLGWSPTGRSVVFASNRSGTYSVWEVPVSKGRPDGEPRLLKRDVGPIRPLGFTRDGTLFYAQAGAMRAWEQDVYGVSIDTVRGTLGEPRLAVQGFRGLNSNPDWSPDGRYLAYVSGRPDSKSYVVSIRDETTGTVREIFPELIGAAPFDIRWSPDGRSLLAQGQDREKQSGVFVIDAKTGDVRPLFRSETADSASFDAQWMPDGRRIVYATNSRRPEVTSTILAWDTETRREQQVLRMTDLRLVGYLALSPDGSTLAFTAHRLAGGPDGGGPTGTALAVIPASGGEVKELIQCKFPDFINSLAWSQDSRSLLFWRADMSGAFLETGAAIWQIPAAGGEPRRLGVVPGLGPRGRLSLHPDGRRLVYARYEKRFDIWAMENLLPKAAEQRQGR